MNSVSGIIFVVAIEDQNAVVIADAEDPNDTPKYFRVGLRQDSKVCFFDL
jgi:hypothetical protein